MSRKICQHFVKFHTKQVERKKIYKEDLWSDPEYRIHVSHVSCQCSEGSLWWRRGREGKVANFPDQSLTHPMDPRLQPVPEGVGGGSARSWTHCHCGGRWGSVRAIEGGGSSVRLQSVFCLTEERKT